jgi:adenosine deaminase
MAYDVCRRLQADGTLYADVIVNPAHWRGWHGRLRAMIEALDAGFAAGERDGLPPVGLCVSVLRTQTAAQATELVEQLVAWRPARGGPNLAYGSPPHGQNLPFAADGMIH